MIALKGCLVMGGKGGCEHPAYESGQDGRAMYYDQEQKFLAMYKRGLTVEE